MTRKPLCALTTLLFCAALAHAAVWTTYDEAEFRMYAGSATTESFENLPPSGGAASFHELLASDLDDHFRVSSDRAMQIWDASFAADGDQVLFWNATSPFDPPPEVAFDDFYGAAGEINSLGMYIIDWASSGAEGVLSVHVNAGYDLVVATSPPSLPDYEPIFFGVITDEMFMQAQVSTTADDGWVFFDEVIFSANGIPEPTALVLLAVGGAALRRSKR